MYDERLPRLILADGMILENSSCGYAEHELHCWVLGKELNEVFSIFTDPEKTKEIRFIYPDQPERIYEGFTEMILIRKLEDHIEARMIKRVTGGLLYDQDDPE